MPDPALVTLARQIAVKYELNDALVCAVVEQESDWVPTATRYEPAFYHRYISALIPVLGLSQEEATARATSWGLMQVMLETAREHGYDGPYNGMLDPATGLEWGCTVFAYMMKRAAGDAYTALNFWNGGGNAQYAGQVIARIDHYTEPATLDAQDL